MRRTRIFVVRRETLDQFTERTMHVRPPHHTIHADMQMRIWPDGDMRLFMQAMMQTANRKQAILEGKRIFFFQIISLG